MELGHLTVRWSFDTYHDMTCAKILACVQNPMKFNVENINMAAAITYEYGI